MPAGQQQKRRTPRSAKRGKECVIKFFPLNFCAPDRHPKGQDRERGLGEPKANRAGCRRQRPTIQVFDMCKRLSLDRVSPRVIRKIGIGGSYGLVFFALWR